MDYLPLSEKEIKEMLKTIGVENLEDLFKSIPEKIKLKEELNLPGPLSEPELINYFQNLASKNKSSEFLSFLGAGAYPHFIPCVVDYLSQRGEFLTPYTPYQPELSQGTLQITFEFQTLICQLTGMDVSNASLYDGSTAMVEAALMAWRVKNKPKILISRAVHPEYREVARTYFKNLDIDLIEINYNQNGETDINELKEKIDNEVAGIIVQSPNFFGIIEKIEKISQIAHSSGIIMITTVVEPLSLAILKPPGECGADIVAGEGQSFGLPLSFGGPYLGILACKSEFVRQMPGRIVGETQDVEGKKGYVLTLSTREQHIRREKATSNICTNQAWCAIRATIYLAVMGKKGLRELAWQNLQKANYARKELNKLEGINVKFKSYFFNEFVVEFKKDLEKINELLREDGIIGGLCLKKHYPELENCMLICVTEMHKKSDIDKFVTSLKKILKN